MKNITILLLFLTASTLFAQELETKKQIQYDKVFFLNGDILEVEIKKIDTDQVQYIFPNEEFMNVIEKKEIEKIVFKSGRVQNFNKIKAALKSLKRPIEKNKLAILPIPFIRQEDGFLESNQKARLAQSKVFNFLTKELGKIYPRTLQTPRETNSILKKAGIKLEELDELPMSEIQSILGVEFIVTGRIDYSVSVNQSTMSTNSGQIKKKKENDYRVNETTMNNSNENILYDYTVYIDLYKNDINIYSRNREPFFNQKNSWEDSFEYVLKRMPIFNK